MLNFDPFAKMEQVKLRKFKSLEQVSTQVDILRYRQYPNEYALLNGYYNIAKNIAEEQQTPFKCEFYIDDVGILHVGYYEQEEN